MSEQEPTPPDPDEVIPDEEEPETPKCVVCGEDAEYDEVVHNGAVERVPTLYDTEGTGDGPYCSEHYEETYDSAYWREYDRQESLTQERRAGID